MDYTAICVYASSTVRLQYGACSKVGATVDQFHYVRCIMHAACVRAMSSASFGSAWCRSSWAPPQCRQGSARWKTDTEVVPEMRRKLDWTSQLVCMRSILEAEAELFRHIPRRTSNPLLWCWWTNRNKQSSEDGRQSVEELHYTIARHSTDWKEHLQRQNQFQPKQLQTWTPVQYLAPADWMWGCRLAPMRNWTTTFWTLITYSLHLEI
jgi:hypothetical protein